MALSPNYGWAEPDNSSLVKNGAQDIRALGDAIDTSVWNIGFGQAGKNKIINGDFGIWQRGTSFSNPANGAYFADRFSVSFNGTGATRTVSRQTFTPGTAPVAGYEGQYFLRFADSVAGSGESFKSLRNQIEDVRTFAGQTITLSYWAKAASAVTLSAPFVRQSFGSGGSANNDDSFSSGASLTTSWQRFSHTLTVDSVAGKTIGTGSFLQISLNLPLNSTFTIDFWGWQLEAGSQMTPFQNASGGSPQAELAMCQRYYYRATFDTLTNRLGVGFATSTVNGQVAFPFGVSMRTRPTALEQSGTAGDYSLSVASGTAVCNAVPTFFVANTNSAVVNFPVASGLTAGEAIMFRNVNTNAYLGWSAEL